MDITDDLFGSLKNFKNHEVVKSQYFNLLEGTRAVEVINKRLDSGLIPLTEEELAFDTSEPQSIEHVVGIMNKLIALYISWLSSSSLPVTVLSCRYVQTFLENYNKNGGQLNKVTFKNDRLKSSSSNTNASPEQFNYKLVNFVLRSYILGICKLIGFSITTAQTVLYEEEDLTTRNMELDFLSGIGFEEVFIEIDFALSWLLKQDIKENEKEIELMAKLMNLVKTLLELPQMLTLSVPVFEADNTIKSVDFIKKAIKIVKEIALQTNETDYEVPKGAISQFIQADFNNRSIPTELYCLSNKESYEQLEKLLNDIHNFYEKSTGIHTLNQFDNFLKYDISYQIDEAYNPLARGMFQLFLIRDDKSILGNKDISLTALTMRYLEEVSCFNSNVINAESWNGIQGNEEQIESIKLDATNKLNQLIMDIEGAIYNYITSFANNRSRQRQLNSKAILMWDTLQVTLESIEIELWQTHKIGDRLYNGLDGEGEIYEDEEEISLSITSFIYYFKLLIMIEVALSGFELELYRDFEIGQIYWYISYLSQLIIQHFTTRINKINNLKIHNINNVIPKKLKKLKAGPKKQALKQIQAFNLEHVLPTLQIINRYNNEFVIPNFNALNLLTESIRLKFVLIDSLNLLQINNRQFEFVSGESLYYIRMKPWSSVGVPALPSYEQYMSSILTSFINNTTPQQKIKNINQIISLITSKLNQAKQIYIQLLKLMKEDEKMKQQIEISTSQPQNIEKWFETLVETCIWNTVDLIGLNKIVIDDKFAHDRYRVNIEPGYHRYFPKVLIIEKTT